MLTNKLLITLHNQYTNTISELLKEEYPYLHFYLSEDGKINAWIKEEGTAIKLPIYLNYHNLIDTEELEKANFAAQQVIENPDKWFYCTECGTLCSIEEYADFVFAARFCKECAKKPRIAEAIAESKQKGFYE